MSKDANKRHDQDGACPPHPDCNACGRFIAVGHCDAYKWCKPWMAWFSFQWRAMRRVFGKL